MTPAMLYATLLHVGALVAVTVLIAMGKISWAEGGPILGGLVGLGVGVPLTPSQPTPPVAPPTKAVDAPTTQA